MMTLQIHTGGINLKKKNIYSIRKLGVGIASVTLGTLLISGGVMLQMLRNTMKLNKMLFIKC